MDDHLKHLLTLGKSYYLRKEYSQAEKYLSQVVDENQSLPDVYNMLGVIFHDQGQFGKARMAFEAALHLNPAYTEAALNLAVIYNDMGCYKDAKEVYNHALSRSPSGGGEIDSFVKGKIANMYSEIGDAYTSSALWDPAIREYRNALELCPDFVDIRMKLAGVLRDKGEKEAAIRELGVAVENKPQHMPARIALGVALYSAGRVRDAMACWEVVLDASPGNQTAEMYLKLVKAGNSLSVDESTCSKDKD